MSMEDSIARLESALYPGKFGKNICLEFYKSTEVPGLTGEEEIVVKISDWNSTRCKQIKESDMNAVFSEARKVDQEYPIMLYPETEVFAAC